MGDGHRVLELVKIHGTNPWPPRDRIITTRYQWIPVSLSLGGPSAGDYSARMIYDNILGTIGRTPVVRLQRLAPAGHLDVREVRVLQPAWRSVKDRLAIGIIEDAERRGVLKPGQTVIEATSGNTGIALAMVCAAKGYPFVAVMVETFSIERRKIMRMLGAKVILTPAAERGTGMVRKAAELAEKNGWFLARQFENPANPAYHRNTTGPEILSDFVGKRLDFFVTGWGTGGTLTGAGEVIRLARPDVRIIVAEPAAAALLSGKPFSPAQDPGLDAGLRARGAQSRGGAPHRHGDRCRGHRLRASARLARRHLRAAYRAVPRWPQRCRWRARRNRARASWRCCPTPANAICRRRLFEGIADGSDPEG